MSQITRFIVFFPQKFWPRKIFGKINVHQSPLLKSLSLFISCELRIMSPRQLPAEVRLVRLVTEI